MSGRPIVMYLGGFAKVGGIEAFARDFLLAMAEAHPLRELVMWGRHDADHRLLNEIAETGVRISRSPWRWGCAWNLPDFLLVPAGLRAIHRAAAIVFQRPPPRPILGFLRRFSRLLGRPIPFIIVVPYRPLEYWGASPHPAEYEHFDIIVVQSEQGIVDLRQMGYRGRIENIPYLPPLASSPSDFPLTSGGDAIRLGFLGRLAAQKNLGYLLEVYQILTSPLDPSSRYELHLFGDGHQRAELEQKVATLGLPRVTFHGEIPREQVAAAIDSCDLFLSTSTTEGQCLVALEVLSRGRPMVATPVGALPEVLAQPELGRLAPLGDVPAFATAVMETVLAIREKSLSSRAVAEAFSRRFDYDAIMNRYLHLLAPLT